TAAGTAAVGSLGGLGVSTAYIIWSGGQTDGFIWGHPTSWDTFWFYVSGADYAHTEHAAWSKFYAHFSDWLAWLTRYGASPLVLFGLGALVGVRTLRTRWPIWGLPCFVGAAFTFTYGVYFPDVPDFNGYLMALVWWCGIGCACMCGTSTGIIGHLTTFALSGTVVVGTWFGHAPDRSENDLAIELAKTWLDQVPKNGLLLAETDHLVFPLMYIQSVEGYRSDVVVINLGFTASGWYWDDLYRTHPDLTRVELRPQPRHERLREFLLKNRQRPTYVENIEIAGSVGIRPCVTTWGLVLGEHCTKNTDHPTEFTDRLAEWWAGAAADDHVSRRVLSSLGAARATALLALGQPKQALEALQAGMPQPMRQTLVVPTELDPSIRHWPLPPVKLLIGTPDHNVNLGRSLLVAQGYRGTDAWLPKTNSTVNSTPVPR
ncbi:MAG: hypothetical protein VX589_21360, partial [Myxococcota bacterium]|nr:hypothetical protein [Myxococcota bacterium]